MKLVQDPVINGIQNEGVVLSRHGDFAGAEERYEAALARLDDAYATGEFGESLSTESLDASRSLHEARIRRDYGFIAVRGAVLEGSTDAMTEDSQLDTSLSLSAGLMRQYFGFEWPSQKRLSAEHGATVSVMGRAKMVESAIDGGRKIDEHGVGLALMVFSQAHKDLFEGSNRYYETSNAVHAARASEIINDVDLMRSWRRKGWESFRLAFLDGDAGKAFAAARTIAHFRLLTRGNAVKAAESVLATP